MKCVEAEEAKKVMRDVHEGVCGPHMNGHASKEDFAYGLLLDWSTMKSSCQHVRKFHLCQIYANKINAPATELHNMTTPWPFSVWGMDVIGPITPKASNGHRFILVAIDSFTKWVEAASYANITHTHVLIMFQNSLIEELSTSKRIVHKHKSMRRHSGL